MNVPKPEMFVQTPASAVIAEPGSREHARSRVATVLEACEWSADGNVQLVPVGVVQDMGMSLEPPPHPQQATVHSR